MQNNYVYRVSKDNMYYIGVRSCDIQPINDIGVKYFTRLLTQNILKNQKTKYQLQWHAIIILCMVKNILKQQKIKCLKLL
jgi:histidinol phosphatase-like enzyme